MNDLTRPFIRFGDAGAVSVSPAVPTYGGIADAIARVVAAGGGTVQLLPELYDISSAGLPIPWTSRVSIVGDGPRLSAASTPVLVGGTIIQQAAGVDIIAANVTDGAQPYATNALALADMVTSAHIRGVGLKNGRYGLRCGALYKSGLYQSDIEDVFFENCSESAAYLENINQVDGRRLISYGCGHGFLIGDSGAAVMHSGNSRFNFIRAGNMTKNGSGRGLHCFVRGGSLTYGSSELNDVWVNNGGFAATGVANQAAGEQNATFTNASANIGVTDLSKFAVGMPVKFYVASTDYPNTNLYVNGLHTFKTWFVKTVAAASGAGNITITEHPLGTSAFVSGGNTALKIFTQGWPLIEWSGAGDRTDGYHNQILNCGISEIDAEVGGTSLIVLSHCPSLIANWGLLTNTNGCQYITQRNVESGNGVSHRLVTSGAPVDAHADYAGVSTTWIGPKPTFLFDQIAGGSTNVGIGVRSKNAGNGASLSLSGQSEDMESDGNFLAALSLFRHLKILSSTVTGSGTLTVDLGNHIAFNGGASQTLTLIGLLTTAYLHWYDIANLTANPVTIQAGADNAAGTAVIYGAATSGTSFVLLGNTAVRLVASNKGGTMAWSRL